MKQEIYICGKKKSELVKGILANFPPDFLEDVNANISDIKTKHLDLPYCDLPDSKTLDIYLPDQGEKPFPVLVFFFGGGFLFGDKRGTQLEIPLLARELGFAVVSVNYTLSSEGEYPRLVYDVKSSIRYLRANAEQYGLDSKKIITIGFSAGGTLSALLGTTSGVKELEGLSFGNSDYSSDVQGVIDFCGPTNILAMKDEMSEHVLKTGISPSLSYGEPDSVESLLFGALASDVPEKAKAFSPITHVNSNVPQFLIIHGAQDDTVPPQQSIELAELIEEKAGKDKVECHILEDAGHCDEEFFKDAVPLMFNFLNKYI
ncbi:alpha/beta hydrolase [Clostridium sp. YIM B02505]|uniref:Alpha/beta hydrolase n=1 Tax=Clostridium yunnanense TaxID=2800325 RepID=A0ABS1EN06_9CLOT|nr:alpha/beta hydrolase [Clostridium yunnanense]MBK1810744.1 alpha/beta hydrolase [Clostridium yunnanense]